MESNDEKHDGDPELGRKSHMVKDVVMLQRFYREKV